MVTSRANTPTTYGVWHAIVARWRESDKQSSFSVDGVTRVKFCSILKIYNYCLLLLIIEMNNKKNTFEKGIHISNDMWNSKLKLFEFIIRYNPYISVYISYI